MLYEHFALWFVHYIVFCWMYLSCDFTILYTCFNNSIYIYQFKWLFCSRLHIRTSVIRQLKVFVSLTFLLFCLLLPLSALLSLKHIVSNNLKIKIKLFESSMCLIMYCTHYICFSLVFFVHWMLGVHLHIWKVSKANYLKCIRKYKKLKNCVEFQVAKSVPTLSFFSSLMPVLIVIDWNYFKNSSDRKYFLFKNVLLSFSFDMNS